MNRRNLAQPTPCDENFVGMPTHAPCRECGHTLGAHGNDQRCDICSIIVNTVGMPGFEEPAHPSLRASAWRRGR